MENIADLTMEQRALRNDIINRIKKNNFEQLPLFLERMTYDDQYIKELLVSKQIITSDKLNVPLDQIVMTMVI